MKKATIVFLSLIIAMCFGTSLAENFEELIKEKEELCQALWYAEEWNEVVLPTGTYEVGKDIPAGKWTFWAYDYARPQIQYGARLMPGGASMHANRDVEKHETVESPKRESFDSEFDDSFFDVELEKGKYICIKYGTALINNVLESKKFDFSHPVPENLLGLSADEIREKINEIDEILKKAPMYETYVLKAGFWTVGEDIPEGTYEVRAEKGNKTQILLYEKSLATTFYDGSALLANIYDPSYEGYEIADDDTVEYLFLENGMKIEVRETYGNAVFSTFIGKEPLDFLTEQKDEEKENHEWKVKTEKSTQDIMLQLYAAVASFSDDGVKLDCSYNYKEKTLYHLYTLTEYTKRDFQKSSGKKLKKQLAEDVETEIYPAIENRIKREVEDGLKRKREIEGSSPEYNRDDFDIIVEWQANDGYVLVKIKNGKIIE